MWSGHGNAGEHLDKMKISGLIKASSLYWVSRFVPKRLTTNIKILKDRFKYRLVLQSMADMFEFVGISVIPYYVFAESISDKLEMNLEPELNPVVSGFLSYSEIEKLCLHPESKDLQRERDKLSAEDGCRCFALKHNEEIVSYTLCNFHMCDSRLLSFPLEKDEVYLTGAYTFAAYRGKKLAAVLEHELYKDLYARGRNKYYSINNHVIE